MLLQVFYYSTGTATQITRMVFQNNENEHSNFMTSVLSDAPTILVFSIVHRALCSLFVSEQLLRSAEISFELVFLVALLQFGRERKINHLVCIYHASHLCKTKQKQLMYRWKKEYSTIDIVSFSSVHLIEAA